MGLAPAAMSICHSLMEGEGLAQPCKALAHLAPNDSGNFIHMYECVCVCVCVRARRRVVSVQSRKLIMIMNDDSDDDWLSARTQLWCCACVWEGVRTGGKGPFCVSAKACSSVLVVVLVIFLGVAPWSRSKRIMAKLWHLTAASSGHMPMLSVAFT
jgi:hypothetical protein